MWESLLTYGVKRGIAWWDKNRPFSANSRNYRQWKRGNRKRRRQGLEPLPLPDKVEVPEMAKLIEIVKVGLENKRTSTKSGLAGLVVPWLTAGLVAVPFYEPLSAYIAEACAQPKPLDFLVAGAGAWLITWTSMVIAARRSKTPANPGVL